MPTDKNNKKAIKVQAEEWYSMQDIINGKFFPWYQSLWKIRNLVQSDITNKNVLKTLVTGSGRGTKYQIKGYNITKFIEAVENGKIKL